MKIIGVSGGVSYGVLGGTHHAVQDVAFMRAVHGLQVIILLKNEDTKAELCGRIIMKRCGDPENIADAVMCFLGERAAWTAGVILPVDGGCLAK